MWILNRDRSPESRLAPDEASLLRRMEGVAAMHPREIERANALLRSVRSQGKWMGCSCRTPMPVMHVALLDDGRLLLRNHPNGADHHSGCPFSKCGASNPGAKKPADAGPERISPDSRVALHAEFLSRDGSTSGVGGSLLPQVKPRRPLLALLLTLAEQAGITAYNPAKKLNITEQFAQLRAAASRYTMAPGVPLDSYLDTRMDGRRVAAMARRLRESAEFGGHRRVGLLMDQVENVKGRKLKLFDGGEADFFGHVERMVAASSPMLALGTLTPQHSPSRFFEIGHVAAMPILNRALMFPVRAEQERGVLREIFALLDWLLGKGVEVHALRRPFVPLGFERLELRSKRTILTLDLTDALNDEQAPDEHLLQVYSLPSLEHTKKQIAARFLRA